MRLPDRQAAPSTADVSSAESAILDAVILLAKTRPHIFEVVHTDKDLEETAFSAFLEKPHVEVCLLPRNAVAVYLGDKGFEISALGAGCAWMMVRDYHREQVDVARYRTIHDALAALAQHINNEVTYATDD